MPHNGVSIVKFDDEELPEPAYGLDTPPNQQNLHFVRGRVEARGARMMKAGCLDLAADHCLSEMAARYLDFWQFRHGSPW